MGRLRSILCCIALLGGLYPMSLAGQGRALIVFAQGGGNIPLNNLSKSGDDFEGSVAGGGGIGLQLGSHYAIRGTVSFVPSKYRGSTLAFSDKDFARTFIGADLQLGFPSFGGLAPYFFAGAGSVIIDPDEPGQDSFSKLAGRFGTGINYVFDNRFTTIFVELGTWVYRFDRLGFDKGQVDLTISAGLAYALPF
ncbi:MAG: hypothetical protein ACE5HT_04870 [Gemmatimonadales bacterium]